MEENKMLRKQILLSCLVIASFILSARATATPTTVVTEAPPEVVVTEAPPEVVVTEAPPEVVVTEAPPEPAEKKVATFIWTQEFDTLSPIYTNMWFVSVVYPAYLCGA